MLKNLFDIFLKATDPRPRYVGSRCLVEKNVVNGCDLCMQACPHDAVRISDHVEITESCTGCGLCVQVCPSGALEYDVVSVLSAIKNQGIQTNTSSSNLGTSAVSNMSSVIACSKVPSDGFKLECLGRLSPSMVLASQAWGQTLTLVRGTCETCALGGPSVPVSIESVLATAAAYRKHLSTEPIKVHVLEHEVSNVPVTDSENPSMISSLISAPVVSRRDALGSLFGSAKRGVAHALPDNPLPGIDASLPVPQIPDEWTWRKKTLKPQPNDDVLQYWPAPLVNEDCIFCPVCTNVCPTNAVRRDLEMDGTYKLFLQTQACTGCNACVVSCPPNAMVLQAEMTFGTLSETLLLREGINLES